MTLKIYPNTVDGVPYSTEAEMNNPLRISFDGRYGGVSENKFYLRNDETAHYYSGIQITPISTGPINVVDGTNGFSWKLKEGNEQPLDQEWAVISDANTILMSGIGDSLAADITTYLPFWLRAEVPVGADVQSFDYIGLEIIADEENV